MSRMNTSQHCGELPLQLTILDILCQIEVCNINVQCIIIFGEMMTIIYTPRNKIPVHLHELAREITEFEISRGETPYSWNYYAAELDCLFEMADIISNGNGSSVENAVKQVIRDENFRIRDVHIQRVISMLK